MPFIVKYQNDVYKIFFILHCGRILLSTDNKRQIYILCRPTRAIFLYDILMQHIYICSIDPHIFKVNIDFGKTSEN